VNPIPFPVTKCGLPARLGGRHACTQILLSLQGKILDHLFLEALVGALSGGEVRKTYKEASQKLHARSFASALKKRAMMASEGKVGDTPKSNPAIKCETAKGRYRIGGGKITRGAPT
jgi:hypothetical protein